MSRASGPTSHVPRIGRACTRARPQRVRLDSGLEGPGAITPVDPGAEKANAPECEHLDLLRGTATTVPGVAAADRYRPAGPSTSGTGVVPVSHFLVPGFGVVGR